MIWRTAPKGHVGHREDYAIGPHTPVPNILVLAVVERAQRDGCRWVPEWMVAQGIGFGHSPVAAAQAERQLLSLRGLGLLRMARRQRGRWRLTGAGRRRLALARREEKAIELIGVSSRWARRDDAIERIDGVSERLREALVDAGRLLTGDKATSEDWFDLGDQIRRECWGMGTAVYCRDEWPG